MKKLLAATVIILTISFFSFAQDHGQSPLPKTQDFAEIQHVYKVDSLSFDDKRWYKIDSPKTVEITADSVITPEKVFHIAKVLISVTGDYVFTFINDSTIYVFDFADDLILVGTKSGLSFVLHIQRLKTPPLNVS